ncbi:MAG: threonine synthase [Syntrophomonas sp.]
MKYLSSRGKYQSIKAAEAIKMGISPDGGLFVPKFIPGLDDDTLKIMESENYQERACRILGYFLSDFSGEEIKRCVYNAYNEERFDDERIAPLVELTPGVYIQELWHGPTSAFKDMALQLLPQLMTVSARKTGESGEIVILVATSGDTGKAALEGFKDVVGTRIIVFYPADGVSEVQKRQMITQEGKNVYVAAVQGNFDDAQTGVKNIFADHQFAECLMQKGMKLSSANSINWGRLLPQIVYYISAYVELRVRGTVTLGEPVNIVVPTGNFGNILAAYYASRMGVPVQKLICASNTNKVLDDFIRTGVYDRNRNFEKTISPSMDILISSNLERLLYEITGHDAVRVAGWMEERKNEGRYEVDAATLVQVQKMFWSEFCTDEETIKTIRAAWEKNGYLLDTHTAVAVNVYEKYLNETRDPVKTIIASTASPFKFGSSVAQAVLDPATVSGQDEFALLNKLAEATGVSIPEGIKGLDKKPVLHNTLSTREQMLDTVAGFLKL